MQINVVIAVIESSIASDSYLIAKRPADSHQGGLWEFPGGKVELNEQPELALVRELKEELDINVKQYKHLFDFAYDYSDKSICFHVYKVTQYSGEECGHEGQDILWVTKKDLDTFAFPVANKEIIEYLLKN